MTTKSLTDFDRQYLETWTEPDTDRRRESIERLWAKDGRMTVSSLGITIDGLDEIAEHIARVHDENIVGRGLRFSYDQRVESGDALLLRWSMVAPDGSVVGRGADVLFRESDGLIKTVHMFMGVN